MTAKTRSRRPGSRKAVFSVGVFIVFWVAIETLLRIFGFHYNTDVETMRFTFPIDEYNQSSDEPFLQRDDELFWKPRPFALQHNSRGMVGPEFADAKPNGIFRIVCLGDSCTHFGPDSYPKKLQKLLNEAAPGRFEVINAGCIGYSSFQGLTLLKTRALDWSPDLVTVYFGWNDHWLARGYPDNQQRPKSKMHNSLHDYVAGLRTYQFFQWGLGGRATSTMDEFRVGLNDYELNLRRMGAACSEKGIPIWYLTAADAFEFGLPEYLRTSGEVNDPTQVKELHDSYNDVVRRVAGDTNAPCLDVAMEFAAMDKRMLFVDDHIHLSEVGREEIANRLLALLKKHDMVPEVPPQK